MTEALKNSPESCQQRRRRRDWRARINEPPVAERFERAAAIFLRLALLAGTVPRRGSALHHRQMHATAGGPCAHAAHVWSVSRELYGWGNPPGVEHARPALDLLQILAGESPTATATTGLPRIPPGMIRAAYRLSKSMARHTRAQLASDEFEVAATLARTALATFFTRLRPRPSSPE